jgi:hypothetical protein
MQRFTAVQDADYNPIRSMTHTGRGICLKINSPALSNPCEEEEPAEK